MSLPNLLIIGAPKCGTTTLHGWLVEHPDVVGGMRKEAQFLVDRGSSTFRPDGNYHVHGIAGYSRLFGDAKVVLDATPGYLYQRTALDVLADDLPGAKLIVVVRDPVQRFLSAHRYYSHAHPVLSAEVTAEQLFERSKRGDPALPANEFVRDAVAHGEYSRYLDEWSDRCGAHRLMAVNLTDIEERPHEVLQSIASWVGIDPAGYQAGASTERRNVGYSVRHHRLHRLVAKHRARLPHGRLRSIARRVYHSVNVVGGTRASPHSPDLIEELARHYAPWNQRLALGYDIDISRWAAPKREL